MPELKSYNYAVVRVVPVIDRDEFVNAGVIVYSQELRFLDARIHLNEERLTARWPLLDLEKVRRHLEAIPRICEGDSAAGPIAKMSQGERFHWLTAPKSTMIQVSPVRTGLSEEPEKVLEKLAAELVS
jgi:hypothetical protein